MSEYLYIRKDLLELVGGSYVEGMLLTQIVSWFSPNKAGKSKLKHEEQGTYWVLQSIAQLSEGLCASPRTVLRALAALEAKGLIHKKQVVQGTGRVLALQINPDSVLGAQVLVKIPLKLLKNCTEECQIGTDKTANLAFFSGSPYIGVKVINLKCASREQKQKPEPLTNPAKEGYTKPEIQGVKMPKTFKTVEELLKVKTETSKPKEAEKQALPLLWKKMVANETQVFQKPLTAAEVGMLNNTKKALGEKAVEALKAALSDWQAFTWEVSKAAGLTKVPELPQVPFYAHHCALALSLQHSPQPTHLNVPKGLKTVPKSSGLQLPPKALKG